MSNKMIWRKDMSAFVERNLKLMKWGMTFGFDYPDVADLHR
jgi:hypothetical protein